MNPQRRRDCKTCYGRGYLLKPRITRITLAAESIAPPEEVIATEHMACPDCQGMDQWLRERVMVLKSAATYDTRSTDHPDFHEHMLEVMAAGLLQKLREAGALQAIYTPENPNELRGKVEVLLSVVMPVGGKHTFADQLKDEQDAAFVAGAEFAISELLENATLSERAGDYGPVQALAMRGVAERLRAKLRKLQGNRSHGPVFAS